jgi:hypothetical protein
LPWPARKHRSNFMRIKFGRLLREGRDRNAKTEEPQSGQRSAVLHCGTHPPRCATTKVYVEVFGSQTGIVFRPRAWIHPSMISRMACPLGHIPKYRIDLSRDSPELSRGPYSYFAAVGMYWHRHIGHVRTPSAGLRIPAALDCDCDPIPGEVSVALVAARPFGSAAVMAEAPSANFCQRRERNPLHGR